MKIDEKETKSFQNAKRLIEDKNLSDTSAIFFSKAQAASEIQQDFMSPSSKRERRISVIGQSLFTALLGGGSVTAYMAIVGQSINFGIGWGLGSLVATNLLKLRSDNHYNKKAAKKFVMEVGGKANRIGDEEKREFAKSIVEVCSKAISEGRPVNNEFISEAKEIIVNKMFYSSVGSPLTLKS